MINTFSLPTRKVLLPTKKVLDFAITALRFEDQIKTMMQWASTGESKAVCVANVHMLMEAYWNPEFAAVLDNADIVTPDGMPLVWMMRLMGARQQDRVAGMDILQALCEQAIQKNISIFFLGSQTEILQQMRARLEREYPGLKIAGMKPLPFRPLTRSEDKALIEEVNESGAGLLLLALGCPKQEHWIAQHKDKINAVMVGLGAVFPLYAGIHKRAPEWVRENGLEWFYRLIQEPRRLWSRYSKTIPPFIWLALKQLVTEFNLHKPTLEQVSDLRRDNSFAKPLGQVLQQAGLVCQQQVAIALEYQAQHPNLRFGDILVQKGWLRRETVDFFADELPKLVTHSQKQPLGYYLKSAALLDDAQINAIVNHQSQVGLRFGEMAVHQGWVKQETIDLFLEYTATQQKTLSFA